MSLAVMPNDPLGLLERHPARADERLQQEETQAMAVMRARSTPFWRELELASLPEHSEGRPRSPQGQEEMPMVRLMASRRRRGEPANQDRTRRPQHPEASLRVALGSVAAAQERPALRESRPSVLPPRPGALVPFARGSLVPLVPRAP